MSAMEDMLNETVSQTDLEKFEKEYIREKTVETQFAYALCLIRSQYSGDMHKGISLLEDLSSRNIEGKRDYIYYLAFANARLHEYTIALKYIDKFLEIEPGNTQAHSLRELVSKKRNSEAAKGAAAVGGAAMVVGGLALLGMALFGKK